MKAVKEYLTNWQFVVGFLLLLTAEGFQSLRDWWGKTKTYWTWQDPDLNNY